MWVAVLAVVVVVLAVVGLTLMPRGRRSSSETVRERPAGRD